MTALPALGMRRDLNLGTTWLLPEWSAGPKGDEQAVLEAALEAGYQGIQGADPQRCRDLGLVPVTFDIRPNPGGLLARAQRWAGQGFACSTLMLGSGFDDDDQCARFAEEVLEVSSAAKFPLYIETHRATITQDIWRTLRLLERFPELRFNGDFSHWYTGHDLGATNFEESLDLLSPVLARVRYLHGRVGASGSIQTTVDPAALDEPPVSHFRSLWQRSFEGFLRTAGDDLVPTADRAIGFAPELLPAEFGYAQLGKTSDGIEELSDRWEQGLVLTRIASDCFWEASKRH